MTSSVTAGELEHRLFGTAIGQLRERRGLSIVQLAFISGLNRDTIAAIERGDSSPTFRTLLAISGALSLPLSEVMGRYEEVRAGG